MAFCWLVVLVADSAAANLNVDSYKEEKLSTLESRAKRGSSEAQYQLGMRYRWGNGTGRFDDKDRAIEWWRKAAAKGHRKAKYAVAALTGDKTAQGKMDNNTAFGFFGDNYREWIVMADRFKRGNNRKKDPRSAIHYMKMAADAGVPYGQMTLGLWKMEGYGGKDSVAGLKLIKQAAKQSATAQALLGRMHYHGLLGVVRSKSMALDWFRKAANKGQANAMYYLGDMYARGDGVRKSLPEGARWFRKAAAKGHAAAQYDLANMYDFGTGVPKNNREAMRLYNQAAANGHPEAEFAIGMMYYQGDGVRRNYQTAFKWLQRSARKGNSKAQSNIGAMYARGYGVRRDLTKAAQWYKLAANNGERMAASNLANLRRAQSGVDRFLGAAVLMGLLSAFGQSASSFDSGWSSSATSANSSWQNSIMQSGTVNISTGRN